MAVRSFSFSSESVTEGHPDKIADQISDSVLDAVLKDDVNGRVACETLITTGLVVVAGEMTTETWVDIRAVVRERIAEIGYTRAKYGFDFETCGVVVAIDEQSADIALGVDESYEAKHGDTDPLDEHGIQRPVEIERVLISTQHRDGLDIESLLKPDLLEHVVEPILHADYRGLYDEGRLTAKDFLYVNPTGKFVIGGHLGDTGLTGRKIVVDTYGGAAPHGGGAVSGKEPTKVDRSAAYAARYVAKNVVAAGLADRCQLQVAYAIGVAHPMSVNIECFGTETVPLSTVEKLVSENFDLRPGAIIRDLDLQRPIYAKTASYGHFGRDDRDFTWERTDKAAALREAAGLLSESAV